MSAGRWSCLRVTSEPARVKFATTILYVDDVQGTLERFRDAFELEIAYLDEGGIYGELASGETTLAFAEREFGRSHFEDDETRALFDGLPRRFELGLTSEDVEAAHRRACGCGMIPVRGPIEQPWGEVVAWVRDPEGILIELSTPRG